MQIEANKVVTLSYILSNDKTGEKIEETSDHDLMEFLFGAGQVIPEFESNLVGLVMGDAFEFSIESEKAYGIEVADNIVNIPIDVFRREDNNEIDTELLQLGAVIPMNDNEGNVLRGKVVDIQEKIVKMDFNHPLAGADLHFKGEIKGVREATPDEIAHGHVHGADGHHHHH